MRWLRWGEALVGTGQVVVLAPANPLELVVPCSRKEPLPVGPVTAVLAPSDHAKRAARFIAAQMLGGDGVAASFLQLSGSARVRMSGVAGLERARYG